MSFLKDVFSMLNSNYNYAVLRNWEGLPDRCSSRDIDIILDRKSYKCVEKDIIEIAKKNTMMLIQRFKSERFNTLIFANAKRHEIIQLDFFFHCSFHGIILMDTQTMLQERIIEDEIYHVDKAVEFLDKFLFNISCGEQYPEKYCKVKEEAKTNERVKKILFEVFGCDNIETIESEKTYSLRKKANAHSVHVSLINHVGNKIRFFGTNLKNWIFPQGISVGFTGADGVGKTTILNLLVDELETTFSSVDVFHFRPSVFANLGDALHDVGLKKEVDHDYNRPHRGGKTNVISSLFRLLYYIADYIIGYFRKIRHLIYRRHVVIFDRYYTDIITDSERSKIFLPIKFLKAMRIFVPKLRYNFLITADENRIIMRKQELEIEEIDKIQANISKVGELNGYYLINNNGSAEEALEEVLGIIYSGQNSRYLR
ncbi:MAG: hypothetical protein LUI14_10765 [Lachnospiraceae bacterium]|nr:hypothetical protein [Lachnospiraceae bacterium]